MPFKELGLSSSLNSNLNALGFTAPTPIQRQAIPVARSGRDVVATAQTGSGKTAAFLLPTLDRMLEQRPVGCGALILTPTRELAQQIHSVFRGLAADTGLRAGLVVGGVAMSPQIQALRDRQVHLIVATPGRLLAHLRENGITMPNLRTLILDEADQMFDLGFFPDVKQIVSRLPAQRQTLLFSATMPPDVAKLGQTLLRDPVSVSVGEQGQAANTVRQVAYPVPVHLKPAMLEHLLERMTDPSVLVFTRTRRGARALVRVLDDAGHRVGELHGDCTPGQRERAMSGFRNRKFPVLVATNIAARGLDIRHVTHVINFDCPTAPEEYVHRIGRTGRAGDDGDAIVLVAPEEMAILKRIERQLRQPIERLHFDDFDYSIPAPPRRAGAKRRPMAASGARSGNGSAAPREDRMPRRKGGKPSRGQGRR
jgi:ATP-dependent RNA helicase RhlE